MLFWFASECLSNLAARVATRIVCNWALPVERERVRFSRFLVAFLAVPGVFVDVVVVVYILALVASLMYTSIEARVVRTRTSGRCRFRFSAKRGAIQLF